MLSDKNKMIVMDIATIKKNNSVQFDVNTEIEYSELLSKLPFLQKWFDETCHGVFFPLSIEIKKKKEPIRYIHRKSSSKLCWQFTDFATSGFRLPISKNQFTEITSQNISHLKNILMDKAVRDFIQNTPFILEIGTNGSKVDKYATNKIKIIIHYFEKNDIQKLFDKVNPKKEDKELTLKIINNLDDLFQI